MNGYERIYAALKGEKADKIPVMLHNFMMAAREHGVMMEQYRNNPKVIAECIIASIDKYKNDGILVDIDTVTLAHLRKYRYYPGRYVINRRRRN